MVLKDIKRGEFFKRKATAKKIYIKDSYDPSAKKYMCINAEDISDSILLKSDTPITQEFTY